MEAPVAVVLSCLINALWITTEIYLGVKLAYLLAMAGISVVERQLGSPGASFL